jgi:eukaryotic translation initiation factor 2C
VVSKRHGSRLFPAEPEGPDALKGNVLPGTVVDTQLVNPLAYEFFLNSHAGIQGTNRPARFNVLLDEHDLGPDGLQLLAFHLSSIYCACSRTLSDPAPARYADKAAAAGAFVGGRDAVAWQVVQPAQASVPALQYRVVVGVQPAAPMWYV